MTEATKTRNVKPSHDLVAAGLVEVPGDYNSDVHARLKESDFTDGAVDKWYVYKATQLETQAAEFRSKAESFSKLGGFTNKKAAKKLLDASAEIKQLMAQLAAEGEDMGQFEDIARAVGV